MAANETGAKSMTDYVQAASRLLLAEGILEDSALAAELLDLLSGRAQDWAERAGALGGPMDADEAVSVAAKSLGADLELRQRLEQLNIDAAELFASFARPFESAQQHTASKVSRRRRRWGQGTQPPGPTSTSPFGDLDASYPAPKGRCVAVSELIDLPIYGPERTVIGVVHSVMLAREGDQPTGIVLRAAGELSRKSSS
jgi:hypothetical protein